MIPPCLTLSNIRYVSRIKWSNPGKGVAPSSTPRCSSYRKGSLQVTLDYSRQLYCYLQNLYSVDSKLLGSLTFFFSYLLSLNFFLFIHVFAMPSWYKATLLRSLMNTELSTLQKAFNLFQIFWQMQFFLLKTFIGAA